MGKKTVAMDMTQGSITRQLISYSVPLILGNLFQLTYNAVDSIIAGRFIGKEALAAEGMASPVMNLVILGISGICMGAGVLMSEFFGAKHLEKLKREMSTAVLFGLYFSPGIYIYIKIRYTENHLERRRPFHVSYVGKNLEKQPYASGYCHLHDRLSDVPHTDGLPVSG